MTQPENEQNYLPNINPAQEIVLHAAQEVRHIVMDKFESLREGMIPIEMASAETDAGYYTNDIVLVKGFIVKTEGFPKHHFTVLTQNGLLSCDVCYNNKTRKPMPREQKNIAVQQDKIDEYESIKWLKYGPKAMELLQSEEQYQRWKEQNSDLPQVAKAAKRVLTFGLWLYDPTKEDFDFTVQGYIKPLKEQGYTREEAIQGYLAIGLDLEALWRQSDEENKRSGAASWLGPAATFHSDEK